mgnify:CR=1 FL=1
MRTSSFRKAALVAAISFSTLGAGLGVMTAQAQIPVSNLEEVARKVQYQPRIQIALLLDTSSSMDGLIAQTKTQLWTLVNELGEGKKYGKAPIIELALYEYGNANLSVGQGYIRQVLSLSSDLDDVSEKLFALSTNGGQEYAGQVLKKSLDDLEWSTHKDDMKLIIIAGNEPFTQGPVSWQSSCERAKSKGVIIDTIHCGDAERGKRTGWKDAADCAGGIYMTINQDEKYVHIPSPYDDDLISLNKKLNKTYISYGVEGEKKRLRQATQDSNAEAMNKGAQINRLYTKSKSNYKNDSWDLVDAYDKDKESVLNIDDAKLPPELKGKTPAQREAFIKAKQAERQAIKKQIASLGKQQKEFVAKKRADLSESKALDAVMVTAVRDQASRSGFKY